MASTVKELSGMLKRGEISSLELTEKYLHRIEQRSEINAFITVTADFARKTAESVDKKRANGENLSVLAGIPAAIKDNICTKNIRTSCASKMLENFIPCYDATVIEKLKSNDFVMLGKLNMDEFAMGSTNESSYFGAVKNPVNTEYVPGGSSGGAAATVADYQAVYALGSDTGGSIRQPSSFCGVVGMKPTYGLVSRYGLIAFASSLDQIGPITRTVEDNAIVMNVIAGHDAHDATSVDSIHPDFTKDLNKGVKGLKIGISEELLQAFDPQIRESVVNSAKRFEKLGADVINVSIPSYNDSLAAYYIISSAEASSNLARYDGIRLGHRSKIYANADELYKNSRSEGFGSEVKRRILLGTFALSAGHYDDYYKRAVFARNKLIKELNIIFNQCDAVITPTTPDTPYKIGEKSARPIEMYKGDICTVAANIAGIPAISIPCGVTDEGLPIGIQLMSKHFNEQLLYRMANAFEKGVEG